MNKVIDELNSRLHKINDKKSLNSDDLEFLKACLFNKWYGIQVTASKVLAKHHPSEASALLKKWFIRHMDHFQINHVAYRSFRPCLKEADIPWLLELYFKHPTSFRTLYLYRADYYIYRLLETALSRFPNEEAIQALMRACETEDNRRPITILAHIHKSRREDVLKSLLENPNVPNKKGIKEAFWAASTHTRGMPSD